MAEAILSLGSNLGCRIKNIEKAIKAISLLSETKIIKISSYYETEPFGVPDIQNNYINCCIKISTCLDPQILLGACLGIEAALGRTREYKFCPRIIDIDLILYGCESCNEKNLTLPHPRMKERAFVLVPLNDICYGMKFENFNFKTLLENCDCTTVKKYYE